MNITQRLCYQSSVYEASWSNGTDCPAGTTPVHMTCQLAYHLLKSTDGLVWIGMANRTTFEALLDANNSFGPCDPSVSLDH